MKQTTDIRENLASGKISINTNAEQKNQELMTSEYKAKLGDCDNECAWVEPYGWIPEAGCPVHD